MARLDTPLRRLNAYFPYIGLGKFANAVSALQQMQELNLDVSELSTASLCPLLQILMNPQQEFPIPCQL